MTAEKVKVKILVEGLKPLEAELTSERSPKTFKKIIEALPLEGHAMRWGDELYFAIPVEAPEENPREIVEKGDIAYWPEGRCLCIFWGPTPISKPGEIRPASPVNVVGKLLSGVEELSKAKEGALVRVERG